MTHPFLSRAYTLKMLLSSPKNYTSQSLLYALGEMNMFTGGRRSRVEAGAAQSASLAELLPEGKVHHLSRHAQGVDMNVLTRFAARLKQVCPSLADL